MDKGLSISSKGNLFYCSMIDYIGLRMNGAEIEDEFGVLGQSANYPSELTIEEFNEFLDEADDERKEFEDFAISRGYIARDAEVFGYDYREVYAKVKNNIREINEFLSERGWAKLQDGSKIYQAKFTNKKILADIQFENNFPEFKATITYVKLLEHSYSVIEPYKVSSYFSAENIKYRKFIVDETLSDEERELEVTRLLALKENIEILNDNIHLGEKSAKESLRSYILENAVKEYG